MDITALITPTTERLFGYGVLGVAVIWLTVLFIMERRDRRAAERAVDAIRKEAADKLEFVQGKRVDEMRVAIASVEESASVVGALQNVMDRRLEAIEKSIDQLKASSERNR